MQQTETYKLNLIDADDPFSPEALNKNAETLEEQLARVDAAAAAEKSRVDAALSARAAQTEIARLESRLAQVDGEAARCQILAYSGNGASTITHTFAFPPKVVIIWCGGNLAGGILCMARGQQIGIRSKYTSTSDYINIKWDEYSVTLTSTSVNDPAESICNKKGFTHHGLVVG